MRVVMVAALAALASAHVIVTPARGPLAVAPLSASAQCVRPVLRTFDEARCGQPNMKFAPVKAINNMKTVKALKNMKAYKVGGHPDSSLRQPAATHPPSHRIPTHSLAASTGSPSPLPTPRPSSR